MVLVVFVDLDVVDGTLLEKLLVVVVVVLSLSDFDAVIIPVANNIVAVETEMCSGVVADIQKDVVAGLWKEIDGFGVFEIYNADAALSTMEYAVVVTDEMKEFVCTEKFVQ